MKGQSASPLPRRNAVNGVTTVRRDGQLDGQPDGAEVCGRESLRFTSHHLVPRSRGGKFGPRALLCPTCHRQLHAMFSEATLAKELNSIETLRANPEVASYLNWVQRQKGPTNFRVRRANNRR